MTTLVLFLCLQGFCDKPLELPYETRGNCEEARRAAIRWITESRAAGAKVGLMAYCR